MKKLYVIVPIVATVAFTALVYWTAAPNPWRTLDCTTGEDGICEVHHIKMERKKVKIIYGDDAWGIWSNKYKCKDEDYTSFSNTMRKEFPHAKDVVFGGDVISNTSPASAYLYVCPRCAEILAARKKQQD